MTNKTLLSLNSYNYLRGGSDSVFFEHARLFRAHGWKTVPFAMQHKKNEPSDWDRYFPEEIELGEDYTFLDKIRMAGKVIYSFEAREKIEALIDEARPSIAHAHCIYHHLSPSVLTALRKRGIPVVMTAHDLKVACPAYKMLNRSGVCEKCKNGNHLNVVLNRCLHDSIALSGLIAVESTVHKLTGMYRNNLDMLIAPSKFYKDKLIEWGWPATKIKHIPNYVDYSAYEYSYQPGSYYLYFGRLSSEKGVDNLIKSAVMARVKLVIAGTGLHEEYLKSLVPNVGCDVQFVGFKSGSDLKELIRNSRAVVLPSEWYENAPVSVLEAYACGKPVIGADIGGIPEMLVERETGALFESGNVDSLSDCLSAFSSLSDEAIAAMGKGAREFALGKFNEDNYYSDMTSLYRDLGVEA